MPAEYIRYEQTLQSRDTLFHLEMQNYQKFLTVGRNWEKLGKNQEEMGRNKCLIFSNKKN
jgi:hypothetical protein